MVGEDSTSQTLGVIPCAISWLFKVINEQKDQTGARFSVRVSAVEVSGKQEVLKDLLADVAQGKFISVSGILSRFIYNMALASATSLKIIT